MNVNKVALFSSFYFVLLIANFCHGDTPVIIVNGDGELLINETSMNKWSSEFLYSSGMLFSDKDAVDSNGDVYHFYTIKRDGNVLFEIEMYDDIIYRVSIYDTSIKIVAKSGNISVGSSLMEIKNILGNYSELTGEASGSFLVIDTFPNVSFYTVCTSNIWEMPAKYRGLSKVELLNKCKVEEILLSGDSDKKMILQ